MTDPATDPSLQTLREVIEALAPLERRAGGPGERQAADWIAERLRACGCAVELQDEAFLDGYAREIGTLSALAVLAGVLSLRGLGGGPAGRRHTRRLGGWLAAAVAAAMADDVQNGPRVFRRLLGRRRATQNVVAAGGDRAGERTLVLLAHHDAAPTGLIFDERFQAWLGETFTGIVERVDTSLPLWWALLASPGLITLGAARGRRGLVRAGTAGALLGTAVFADVARSPVCPGANDNLTAVAVQVALAERLRSEPPEGLRVLFVSCGAEEVLQGGIHGFAARHFPSLPRERTWFLNLETLGSPGLILIEGEGPVIMEDYFDRGFRDLIGRAADRARVPLRRGMRSRNSTDSVIPSRAGYPTATLASMDRYKALSNYHKLSDTPENVNYRTVLGALAVTEQLVSDLAASRWH